jgi:hypothetical protein
VCKASAGIGLSSSCGLSSSDSTTKKCSPRRKMVPPYLPTPYCHVCNDLQSLSPVLTNYLTHLIAVYTYAIFVLPMQAVTSPILASITSMTPSVKTQRRRTSSQRARARRKW